MYSFIKYQLKSLKRFNIAYYQLIPEYLGLILLILVFTTMILGVSSDEAILINEGKVINYNYLIIYFFIFPIVVESLIVKDYMPNYYKLKLLFPFSIWKIILLDLFLEVFGYKLLIPIIGIVLYFFFSYFFNLIFIYDISFFSFSSIVFSYLNSCMIIKLFKIFSKDNIINKNYMKIVITLFIGLLFLKERNYTLESINAFLLLFLSLILILILIFSFNKDKV